MIYNKGKKLIYNIIPIAVLIITLVFAGGILTNSGPVSTDESGIEINDSNFLVVRNLCVGDADSAIIQHGGEIGIIDTGTADCYDEIAASINRTGAEKISFMILTHYDKDHIGSALEIINNYDIETIFIPDYVSQKKNYEALMAGIADMPDVRRLSEDVTYKWNDVNIEIIVADDSYFSDDSIVDNNESLVCLLSYGANRLLFTGDIEKERINDLLESGVNLSCDWIKIPHHGRDTKQALKLEAYTTPEYAVISTSVENNEAVDTASALTDAGVMTFNTCEGEVITVANGITVSTGYANSYSENNINEMRGMLENEVGIID